MTKYFHTVITLDGVFEVPFTQEEAAERELQEFHATWAGLRFERDQKLQETDVLVLPDRWMRYTPEKQQAISDYRQALRDLPDTVEDPFNFTWPEPPNI
jgi:hypothetical protein